MRISGEGKLSLALGLAALVGAGVVVVAHGPIVVIAGWSLIAAGVVGGILLAHHHFQRRRMIPLIGMIASSLGLIGFSAWYFWPADRIRSVIYGTASLPSSTIQPILRIAPIKRDEPVSWSDKALLPQENPFKLRLKNIGAGRAINVRLTFRVALDAVAVRRELDDSKLFDGYKVRGETVRLPFSKGNAWSSQDVPLTNKGIRNIDAIDTQGDGQSQIIDYPANIKSMLAVWILSKSSRIEQWKREKNTPAAWEEARVRYRKFGKNE